MAATPRKAYYVLCDADGFILACGRNARPFKWVGVSEKRYKQYRYGGHRVRHGNRETTISGRKGGKQ